MARNRHGTLCDEEVAIRMIALLLGPSIDRDNELELARSNGLTRVARSSWRAADAGGAGVPYALHEGGTGWLESDGPALRAAVR